VAGVTFPARCTDEFVSPTTRPLSLIHHHGCYISHFVSSDAAVKVIQYYACLKRLFVHVTPKWTRNVANSMHDPATIRCWQLEAQHVANMVSQYPPVGCIVIVTFSAVSLYAEVTIAILTRAWLLHFLSSMSRQTIFTAFQRSTFRVHLTLYMRMQDLWSHYWTHDQHGYYRSDKTGLALARLHRDQRLTTSAGYTQACAVTITL
jgi:hypothetical protein